MVYEQADKRRGRADHEQAKRAATDATELVTVRGEPAHVFLSSCSDPGLQSEQRSLAEVLALPADEAEIAFEPAQCEVQFKPVDLTE